MKKPVICLVAMLIGMFGSTQSLTAQIGPAPTFTHVRKTDPNKGHAMLVRRLQEIVHVPVREKIIVNGKAVEVTKFATRTVFREVDVVYDLSNARIITPDGKQLPIDEVWKRLKANTVVAISGDASAPAEVFLRALNPQTLVIIPPPPKVAPQPK